MLGGRRGSRSTKLSLSSETIGQRRNRNGGTPARQTHTRRLSLGIDRRWRERSGHCEVGRGFGKICPFWRSSIISRRLPSRSSRCPAGSSTQLFVAVGASSLCKRHFPRREGCSR